MQKVYLKIFASASFLVVLSAMVLAGTAPHSVLAQQPTGSIPTVTGTPVQAEIIVTYEEQINVRSGPNSRKYPAIGIMFPGQTAPAIGRSPGGDWILIYFPGVPGNQGWVYSPLVSYKTFGFLPIVEPPPTPTAQVLSTIDPTLAAAYIPPVTPTRLPTFTPPAALVIPTFVDESQQSGAGRIPMGLVIFILAFIGGLGALSVFLRR